MQTFRRLNDPERYYGLSWRGWLAAGGGVGLLYGAVRFSPLAVKPTISITVITLAILGSLLYGLSGQALGPGRFALAAARYALARKQLTLSGAPDRHGLVLASGPPDPDPAARTAPGELQEVLA